MVLTPPPQKLDRPSRSATRASGPQRDAWIKRNWYYYRELQRICRDFVPGVSRTLVVGSQSGHLLPAIEPDPASSVAVESSADLVEYARRKYPEYRFEQAEPDDLGRVLGDAAPFDYIVIPDRIGLLDDLQRTFRGLHTYCRPGTRLGLTSYNFLCEAVLDRGERLGMKSPEPDCN